MLGATGPPLIGTAAFGQLQRCKRNGSQDRTHRASTPLPEYPAAIGRGPSSAVPIPRRNIRDPGTAPFIHFAHWQRSARESARTPGSRMSVAASWRLRCAIAQAANRFRIKDALTPPNPNPLSMACSIAWARALPAIRSRPAAIGSGCSRFSTGGAIWSRKANAVKIAAAPPAAPNIWPRADLVAVIEGPESAPNT